MQTFAVRFQAMCAEKIGPFLWADMKPKDLLLQPRLARFDSIAALQEACERVHLPCQPWGGPDPKAEFELTAQHLSDLGFVVKGSSEDYSSAARALAYNLPQVAECVDRSVESSLVKDVS